MMPFSRNPRRWLIALIVLAGTQRADAQSVTSLVDDIIIITKGQQKKEQARTETSLGLIHGTSERPFATMPSGDESRLGRLLTPGGAATGNRDVASAASDAPRQASGATQRPGIAPSALLAIPDVPLFGTLDIPTTFDPGPPDGLTLDAAIDRLLQASSSLGTKFQEIPKAQADLLTAGLRNNPLVFGSAADVPYGSYSPQRPGTNGYSFTLIQPIDANRKRQARVQVAQDAKKVLEAQYQDAVRLEIDNLYTAFVNVLEAREAVRFSAIGLAGLREVSSASEILYQKGSQPSSDRDAALIQLDTAEVATDQANVALSRAKRTLGTLLAWPIADADQIEIQGTIRDETPPPPSDTELIQIALYRRPDVIAYRLAIRSAEANVRLQKKEGFADIFVLYTPYGFTNYAPQHLKSATGWSAAVFGSVPLYNRNQGNVQRAEHTVTQTKIEINGLERQVVGEVQQAALEYRKSRDYARRFEDNIVPRGRRLRDAKYRLYTTGEADILAYLDGQKQYNDIVRQYLAVLIRHRRDMLRLNSALGMRLVP